MKGRKLKYLVAGLIVVAALVGLIYSGVRDSMVYFYTPTELKQKQAEVRGKALRLGGMVVDGSVRWDPQNLLLTFQLTDGAVVHGPATARQPAFDTRIIEGGVVQVRPALPIRAAETAD